MKIKVNNLFKVITTTLLVITFTLSVMSCKEEAIEELAALVEAKADFEKPIVEEKPEETTPTTEETKIEFDETMIKNRFVAPEGIPPVEKSRIVGGEEVPLWYCQEYIENEITVSGIVAGSVRKDIGDTGEEEYLLPVAFQNPGTGKFYVRDMSFGNDAFFSQLEGHGGFPVIFFKDYTFTVVTGGGGYRMTVAKFESIASNFRVGDQIAFNILLDMPGGEEGWDKQSEEYKVYKNFMDVYIPNTIAIYKTMKENEELPEVRLFAWTTIVKEAENRNQ